MNWKHMITLNLVLASLMLFTASPIVGQPRGQGPQDPEEQLERHLGFLGDKLDLAEDQSNAVRVILENAHAAAADWRAENPEARREDRRAFRDEQRDATDAAILDVLTDDQKAAFVELKDFRGPGRHGMGQGRGWHGRRGEKGMGGRLDLDDTQRTRLQSIRGELREEALAWREDNPNASTEERAAFRAEHQERRMGLMGEVLTEAQMAHFRDRGHMMRRHARRPGREFGATMRELKLTDEQTAAIRGILTEEQNAKLDDIQDRRGDSGFRGRGGHRDGPGMFLNRLDLSDDQKEQLKTLRESHQAAAKAWHEANPSATREERQAFRTAHREGMKAMLESVLTKEQMEKLERTMAK